MSNKHRVTIKWGSETLRVYPTQITTDQEERMGSVREFIKTWRKALVMKRRG